MVVAIDCNTIYVMKATVTVAVPSPLEEELTRGNDALG